MSRAYRFAVMTIIIMLAVITHYFGTALFHPSGDIAALVDPAVGVFIDADFTDTMYMIFSQIIPLLLVGFAFIWGFASEYEQQTTTTRRR